MISIITSYRSPHQNVHALALFQGLSKIGISSRIVPTIVNAKSKVVACWGWRLGKKLRDMGKEVLVMERGYVGDRFYYTSLGWNGLNNYATFPKYEDDGGKRFAEHGGILKPWKNKKDGYALILGQVPGDASLQGQDLIPWYEEISKNISDYYGVDIFFRPHPDNKKRGIHQILNNAMLSPHTSLEEAINGANFTVCWNSNSAVDSILAGKPCIIGDKGTMAYEMCSMDYKTPIMKDRHEWANKLAFKQWSIDEIKSGEALERLKIADKLNA